MQGVTVWLPPALRPRAGNRKAAVVEAGTVRDVIEALDRAYPGLGFNIRYETGELRRFVNIFLDGEEIRHLQELDTPVPPGATVHILHSVAGGVI